VDNSIVRTDLLVRTLHKKCVHSRGSTVRRQNVDMMGKSTNSSTMMMKELMTCVLKQSVDRSVRVRQ
jgi:hypothetical protein